MARRIFTDRQGADWTVIDVPRSAPTGLHSESWLCFKNAEGDRVRLPSREVKGDWKRLHRAELNGLLDRALESVDRGSHF